MHVLDTMRHTPGVRAFADELIPPQTIERVLDAARYAPSGMNRQPWRVVAVTDPAQRRAVGSLYARVWQSFVAERVREGRMARDSPAEAEGTRFAQSFATVPAQLAVWVDVQAVDVTDELTQSPSIVAGGSVFPFVQNILLASRAEGIGTRLTTLLAREPAALRQLLRVPDNYALACVIAMGYPDRWPTRLSRRPVDTFATWDHFDGIAVLPSNVPAATGAAGEALPRTSLPPVTPLLDLTQP